MKFHVLTLFPEMFDAMKHSIIKRAQEDALIDLDIINIRDYSTNKHHKVDDYPYGGGAGMVMQVQPIADALKDLPKRVVYLTPKGKVFNQSIAKELSKESSLVLLCGHYEGVDQRVIDKYVTDEISIGDYVLTGGELPAMILIDAIARLKDGVLGQNVSYEDESHYNGLLEYPHYTRPAEYDEMAVPDVLLSGNHKKIDEYRFEESIRITLERRPDMIEAYKKRDDLTVSERKILEKYLDKSSSK